MRPLSSDRLARGVVLDEVEKIFYPAPGVHLVARRGYTIFDEKIWIVEPMKLRLGPPLETASR